MFANLTAKSRRIPMPAPLAKFWEWSLARRLGFQSVGAFQQSQDERRQTLLAQVKAWTESEARRAS